MPRSLKNKSYPLRQESGQTVNSGYQLTNDGQSGNYVYDADGNPTQYGSTVSGAIAGVFNSDNELTAYSQTSSAGHTIPGTTTTSFTYRPDGLRATDADGSFRFYDGTTLLYTWSSSDNSIGHQQFFGWGPRGLVEKWTFPPNPGIWNQIASYVFDPLGNVSGTFYSYADRDGWMYPNTIFDVVTLFDAFGWERGAWLASGYTVSNGATNDVVGWGGQWGAYTDITTGGVGTQ